MHVSSNNKVYFFLIFIVEQAHFKEVYNISGGIAAFAEEVDPKVGTY
jgi:rhodanese-related sulfurtransferase